MLKGLLQSELFYCNHLGASENDEKDIMKFSIDRDEGSGLLEYLQNYALTEEENGIMRTYIVRDKISSEVAGYFSLKAGLISLNERFEKIMDSETGEVKLKKVFDTLPGIELANFAVNSEYVRNHKDLKGLGTVIFNNFILPVVRKTSDNVGVKLLYIFALPYEDLINTYHERYGFSRLSDPYEDELHKRLKPYYDLSCKFMYLIL
ncbi:hypothetical protein [Ruminococcus sp. HUN007]|uniref:hypothetical protein n=1 Tax=Ruminococcus sp. HUN007 TaxID=1514668 RepID=UPI000678A516|nr:hypothetical protein [Ruminococcus sp. HUN007]